MKKALILCLMAIIFVALLITPALAIKKLPGIVTMSDKLEINKISMFQETKIQAQVDIDIGPAGLVTEKKTIYFTDKTQDQTVQSNSTKDRCYSKNKWLNSLPYP